ncbi:MAG TPA: helix-turn-helix domain-containing protein [Solirubrobacteraceae bacterium]|jgi:sugar diacid utilization regulator|nr:helix-turn-helix domain-containing protein [Solirubrobacteraceae bacterium]
MAERLPDEAGPLGAAAPLVERLRRVHLEMVEAVLGGEGLGRVAELAAAAAGAPVAVVVPRLDEAVAAPTPVKRIDALRRYVVDKLRDRPVRVPDGIVAEVPIASGDEVIGAVLLLDAAADVAAPEFLHLAAVASLTEVAIAEARDEVEQNLRGSLLEELRTRPDAVDAREIVRRAGRLGCDLSQGGVALCAKLTSDRPRHVVALITGEYGGALAQHMEGRVYALLPSVQEGSPLETQDAARRLAGRLERYGAVGLSSFYSEPADLPRGLQEAELVVDVLEQSDGAITEDIGTGTYRLLFRVLASHPEEVRSFFEDTVAPLVRYDDQYGTDLVGTLDAYLENNCNMNATAAMIYAHRHTVAYRLDRVRELTGLDPVRSEDRERLGLGLKAYRIIAPRLPR